MRPLIFTQARTQRLDLDIKCKRIIAQISTHPGPNMTTKDLSLFLSLLATGLGVMNPMPALAWLCSSNCEWYQPDCAAWKALNCRPKSESTLPSFGPECVIVSSGSRWQRFNLSRRVRQVVTISGAWSVDARSFAPVGPRGHQGMEAQALNAYNQYKYDQRFPFGALLIGDGQQYFWIQERSQFNYPTNVVDLRINDSDDALGDNAGSLRVCFN